MRCSGTEWYQASHSLSGETHGVLPAGQTQTKLVVRLPQANEWRHLWWDTWIDGVHDPDLSFDSEQPVNLMQTSNSRWQTGHMSLLEASDSSGRKTVVDQGLQIHSPGLSLNLMQGELADNWLDYTPYDFVSIEFDELVGLVASNPARVAPLLQWVRAGGVLWIEQVGDDWQRLQELHQLFGWDNDSPIEPSKPINRQEVGALGWTYVDLVPPSGVVSEPELMRDFDPSQPAKSRATDKASVYTTDWFVGRRFDWGMVIAFHKTHDEPPRSMNTARNQLMAGTFWKAQAWPVRHGLTPGSANGDFSNWLIPGVGLAPVVSFQVLITLFVLVIGPLNYWILKRLGRLHLMVVTVPTAALLITGALLAYGLFSDGLATRLRTQSITLLDQRSNQATTWSRMSYYAAFAPRNGLTFSDQTAVYPIYPGLVESYAGGGSRTARTIEWADGQQKMTSGWMASRTPTQFLAIEPRETQAELIIDINQNQSRVENQFDAKCQLICVVDEEGEWLMAEQVEAGQTSELERVKRSDAIAAYRKTLTDREPRFPGAIDAANDSPLLYEQRRTMRRRNRNRNYSYVEFGDSNLHDRWQDLLGFSGGEALNLSERSYVMVTELAPLPLSRDNFAVEDSSVHIVIGRW